MKKIFTAFLFCFSLAWMSTSAQAQNQNTCYAYGHHKVACPGSSTDQKTVSQKENVEQKKDSNKQSDKKESSAPTQDKKKYNAEEFKTKRYFFKSL